MREVNLLIALALLLVLGSCGETAKYNAEDVLTAKPHDLELNNGEKWVVDKEMMVEVANIDKALSDFEGQKISDYHNLAKKIKTNLSALTSSCTMIGQSHDELHKWLLPFFDLNFSLLKSTKIEEANVIVESIEFELLVFHVYFK